MVYVQFSYIPLRALFSRLVEPLCLLLRISSFSRSSEKVCRREHFARNLVLGSVLVDVGVARVVSVLVGCAKIEMLEILRCRP
jgi:hypothetical protein